MALDRVCLVRNRLAYAIGDSLVGLGWGTNGDGIDATEETLTSRNWAGWAFTIMNQQIWLADSFGVGGANAEEIKQQYMTNIVPLAYQPGFVVVSMGGNDFLSSQTAETLDGVKETVRSLASEIEKRGSIGLFLINGALDASLDDNVRSVIYDFNTWLIRFGRTRSQIITIDGFQPVLDPDSADGKPLANMLYDSDKHYSSLGAQKVGKRIATIIQRFVPNDDPFYCSADDQHGTYQNYAANATATGTGGALAGGATGTVADGMIVQKAGTITLAASKQAADSTDWYPGDWQRMTFSSGASGGLGAYLDTVTPPAAGKMIYAQAEVRASSLVEIASVYLEIRIRNSSNATVSRARSLESNDDDIAIEDFEGIIRTPALYVPSTVNDLQVFVYVVATDSATNASGVVDVRRMEIREPEVIGGFDPTGYGLNTAF